MLKALKPILVVTALVLIAASPSREKVKAKETPKTFELRQELRDLWQGHIFWVRSVVVATGEGNADAAKVAEDHVIRNARDIANAVVPYCGKETADQLYLLLDRHYGAIREYMTAAYGGDDTGKSAAEDNIRKNAAEIAHLLSGANPNWPKEPIGALLLADDDYHIAQINALKDKNYSVEARTWEAMKSHTNMVADALGKGMVKQLPKIF